MNGREVFIVARIADDKNYFVDFVYAAFELKRRKNIEIFVTFVGGIYSESIYRMLTRLIELLGLEKQFTFTGKSIRFDAFSEAMKCGYFMNFSVGSFIGYSGIESIQNGLKTIFYNVDRRWSDIYVQSPIFLRSVSELIELFEKIAEDNPMFDQNILIENKKVAENFFLSEGEKNTLLSILV